MRPRTNIQKEVARLSKRLPALTEVQQEYAFRHCFKHYAIKRANGTNFCTECGHSWKSEHDLADTICGCTCPHCGMTLESMRTRKSVFSGSEYFSILTRAKQYQVIRFFLTTFRYKAGEAAEYTIYEVVQRWISPKGTAITIARLRGMFWCYYDLWSRNSDMEIRQNGKCGAYDIDPICTYPRKRFIPELKRNGFKGNCENILPYDLFKALLADSRAETLMKVGRTDHLRYFIAKPKTFDECWQSYKITIRNGYEISDISIWCDYIRLLRHFGKDLCNPHFVCPTDLRAAHDQLVKKRNAIYERERVIRNRERNRQRMEEERQRLERLEDEKAAYLKQKANFLNLTFTDGLLFVHMLQSVDEFYEEGKEMQHCVFSNAYYNKEYSLILSATINGKRIETIEVSLKTFQIVQSRGLCNANTEYHDRIINLVNDNINLIRQRMKAA